MDGLSPTLQAKLRSILREVLARSPSEGRKLLGDLAGSSSSRLTSKDRIAYSLDETRRIIYIERGRTHSGEEGRRWACIPRPTGGEDGRIAPPWTLDGQAVVFRRSIGGTLQDDLHPVAPGGQAQAEEVPAPARLMATDTPSEVAPTMVPDQAALAFASTRTGGPQTYLLGRTAQPTLPPDASPAPGYGFLPATDPAWAPGLP